MKVGDTLDVFLGSIKDDEKKTKLTNDTRYKIISKSKREKYIQGYVDRLGRLKVLKAIKKNPLDVFVFLILIVVYSMVIVLFVFWADNSCLWALFMIDAIPVAALFVLIIVNLCKETRINATNNEIEDQTSSSINRSRTSNCEEIEDQSDSSNNLSGTSNGKEIEDQSGSIINLSGTSNGKDSQSLDNSPGRSQPGDHSRRNESENSSTETGSTNSSPPRAEGQYSKGSKRKHESDKSELLNEQVNQIFDVNWNTP